MKIEITYCVVWNYEPHASRVEAEIRHAFPSAQIALVKGGGGVFDVHVDGQLLYSKQTIHCGQFPEDGVIAQLIVDGPAQGA